jgi:hypothetical protein
MLHQSSLYLYSTENRLKRETLRETILGNCRILAGSSSTVISEARCLWRETLETASLHAISFLVFIKERLQSMNQNLNFMASVIHMR